MLHNYVLCDSIMPTLPISQEANSSQQELLGLLMITFIEQWVQLDQLTQKWPHKKEYQRTIHLHVAYFAWLDEWTQKLRDPRGVAKSTMNINWLANEQCTASN